MPRPPFHKGTLTEQQILERLNYLVTKFQSTKGHKKLLYYFEEILKSDYFREKIASIKKRYKISENGYSEEARSHIPVFPNEWVYQNDVKKIRDLDKEIKDICKKFRLHYMDWKDPIEEYIFYNAYTVPPYFNAYNMCLFSHVEEENSFGKEFMDSDNTAYPLAIRISPYASLRDILDYAKVLYADVIEPMQARYKESTVKIGRIKKKNPKIQERNKFIFDNRHLPPKKIMSLLYEKYGLDIDIDYGTIGKIVSLEKKKRKEM